MARIQARYIPKGSTKVTSKNVEAVVYLYGAHKPCAIAYAGKAGKPSFHGSFRTEERRAAYITEWFAGQEKRGEYKAQRAAQKKAFVHSLKVDDILHTSWGYEQTNVEFFQVLAVVGTMVEIRELCQNAEDTGYLCGKCVPVPNKFRKDEKILRRRVLEGNIVKIHKSFGYASLYEMKEIAPGLKVGREVYWSAYA